MCAEPGPGGRGGQREPEATRCVQSQALVGGVSRGAAASSVHLQVRPRMQLRLNTRLEWARCSGTCCCFQKQKVTPCPEGVPTALPCCHRALGGLGRPWHCVGSPTLQPTHVKPLLVTVFPGRRQTRVCVCVLAYVCTPALVCVCVLPEAHTSV